MNYITRFIGYLLVAVSFISAQPCQDYKCDSVALRKFYIACGADSNNIDLSGWIITGKRLERFSLNGTINSDSLPDEIGGLTALKDLYLSNKNLKYLPPTIGNLTNLEYLDLSENQIEELPNEIGRLTKLRHFDLRLNNIHSLPDSIVNLVHLEPWLDTRGYQCLFAKNYICSLPVPVAYWADSIMPNWACAQKDTCTRCNTVIIGSMRSPEPALNGNSPPILFDLRGKKVHLPAHGGVRNALSKGCYIIKYGTATAHFRRYVVP